MDQRPDLIVAHDRMWARPVVLIPAFSLISLVAGALPSFSLPANLMVFGVGGTLVWLGLSGAVPRRPAPRTLPPRAAWWLVPLLLLGAVELTNFTVGSTYDHPTLSKLVDPVLERYMARSALYFGWLSAFWAMVRR